MKRTWLTSIIALISLSVSITWAKPVALLVGISEYHPEGGVSKLLGPKNDVLALQDVLTKTWGFSSQDVKVLLNEQATHANILHELNELKTRSQVGDHLFIYFSGHGTSAFDLKMGLPLPHTTGGFVPYDFSIPALKQATHLKLAANERHPYLNQHLLVGQWHLRPILQQLEKDRTVTIMMDSCFSGKSTRSTRLRTRTNAVAKMMPLPHQMMSLSIDQDFSTEKEEIYPYQNVISIVASRETEIANDLQDRGLTWSGKEHGLLTDIMLRILHGNIPADLNQDGRISYAEVRDVIRKQASSYPLSQHQSPQVFPDFSADRRALNQQALFSQRYLPPTAIPRTQQQKVRINIEHDQIAQIFKSELTHVEWIKTSNQQDLKLVKNQEGWNLSLGNGEMILTQANKQQIIQRIKAEIWLKHLQSTASSKSLLNIQATPTKKDHVFDAGDRIQFQIQSDRNAQVILLTLNAAGKIRLLYPIDQTELKPIKAQQIITFPEQDRILVQAPFGLETVIALTLTTPLPALAELNPMIDHYIALDDPILNKLEQAIQKKDDLAVKVLNLRSYEKFIAAQP